MTNKLYRCKTHNYEHFYTQCNYCQHQYCSQMWRKCPRCLQAPAITSLTDPTGMITTLAKLLAGFS